MRRGCTVACMDLAVAIVVAATAIGAALVALYFVLKTWERHRGTNYWSGRWWAAGEPLVRPLQDRLGKRRALLALAVLIGLLGGAAVLGVVEVSPFGTSASSSPVWGWFLLGGAGYMVVLAFTRFTSSD